MTPSQDQLTHLQALEAESIEIFREVAAAFERPVMMYSIGKDSSVLLHLARKAFYPSRIPFPVLHIDTTWKFREMIAFRDRMAKDIELDLIVHTNQDGVRDNINPFDHGSARYTDIMKTAGAAPGAECGPLRRRDRRGAARRGKVAGQGARLLAPQRQHAWDPKNQRPELWRVFNTRLNPGESMRVFPLSQLDRARHLDLHLRRTNPHRAALFRQAAAGGRALGHADHGRRRPLPLEAGETPREEMVRFRTLGCYPLTGAIRSDAATLAGDHHGDAGEPHLRARGPPDRHRPGRLDGKEKAGRVFLRRP